MLGVTDHSHGADVARVQANKRRENLKAKTTIPRGTPGQLILDYTLSTTVDAHSIRRCGCS